MYGSLHQVQAMAWAMGLRLRLSDGSDAIPQTNKYATVACDKTNSRDKILTYEQCHTGHLLP